MADKREPNQAFNFFGLPRELRDQTYTNMVTDIEISSGDVMKWPIPWMRVIVKNGPVLRKLYTLAIRYRGGAYAYRDFHDSPKDSRKMEIEILALCTWSDCKSRPMCRGALHIFEHSLWITRALPQFPSLEEVAVKLYVSGGSYDGDTKWPQHAHATDFSSRLDKFLETQKLSRLEVYPFAWDDKYRDIEKLADIYDVQHGPAAVWTKDGGWEAAQGEEGAE